MSALESAREYWSTRSARERTALLVASAAVAAAALYLLLLGPGLEARAKLSAALPKLRAQLEDMRQQEKEIVQLRKKVGAKPQRADLKPLLQSAIARTAFANSVVRIDTLAGDRALLVVTPVVFDDWIEWIEQLQREFGIRLDDVRIAALDQPGLVRIEATFASAGQLASAAPR